jgi:hypothetical protein
MIREIGSVKAFQFKIRVLDRGPVMGLVIEMLRYDPARNPDAHRLPGHNVAGAILGQEFNRPRRVLLIRRVTRNIPLYISMPKSVEYCSGAVAHAHFRQNAGHIILHSAFRD